MPHPVIEFDECISCGACVDVCPADVLELGPEHVDIVNPDDCIACGACVEACPTGAIPEIAED